MRCSGSVKGRHCTLLARFADTTSDRSALRTRWCSIQPSEEGRSAGAAFTRGKLLPQASSQRSSDRASQRQNPAGQKPPVAKAATQGQDGQKKAGEEGASPASVTEGSEADRRPQSADARQPAELSDYVPSATSGVRALLVNWWEGVHDREE